MVSRLRSALILTLALVCLWGDAARGDTPARASLFRLDTGQVISAEAPRKPLPMASTTKLMTALVAADRDWDSLQVTSRDMAGTYPCMSFVPGTELSRRDALSAMLLCSANEIAQAIGNKWDYDGFVDEMNARARKLGMTDTEYQNTHGLDAPGHRSSCADLITLAEEVLRNRELRELVGQSRDEITVQGSRRQIESTFRPFLESVPGALGVKTGTTTGAGSCFVGAARLGDHVLYCAILHSNKGKAYRLAAAEMNRILTDYRLQRAVKKGEVFRSGKDFDGIAFASRNNTDVLLTEGEKYTVTLGYDPKYPVRRGDRAAWVRVTAPGYDRRIPLYAEENRLRPRREIAFSALISLLCLAMTGRYFADRAARGRQ